MGPNDKPLEMQLSAKPGSEDFDASYRELERRRKAGEPLRQEGDFLDISGVPVRPHTFYSHVQSPGVLLLMNETFALTGPNRYKWGYHSSEQDGFFSPEETRNLVIRNPMKVIEAGKWAEKQLERINTRYASG